MVLAMLGIFLLRLAEHILLIDLLFAIFGILMSTVAVKAAVEGWKGAIMMNDWKLGMKMLQVDRLVA